MRVKAIDMRLRFMFASLLIVGVSTRVPGQSLEAPGSAGPTLIDRGYSLAGGAGLQVPPPRRLSLFADARMMVGSEAGETLAVAPLRVGVRWRF